MTADSGMFRAPAPKTTAMELEDVRKNYDRTAPGYHRRLKFLFGTVLGIEKYRVKAVDRLGDIHGATVLDIGCGTGANLSLLAPRLGPGGRAMGIDYSEGMLADARRRMDSVGFQNVELIRGDAVRLEGVPERVDAVISTYCLGIVYDIEAALHRALEVLRPGGRIAILDFGRSRPDSGPLWWLYPAYSAVFRWYGISGRDDLDDVVLRERWRRGRRVLENGLVDLREERFLWDMGILISGQKA